MGGTLRMLRSAGAFAALQESGRGGSHALVAIRIRRNDLGHDRYGISTGKRVGTAVTRNRIRRRIREILRSREGGPGPGWDILVVARPAAATATHADLRAALLGLLARAIEKEGTIST